MSYSEAMAKHYHDKENKGDACMEESGTERLDREYRLDREELARRHRKEDEILAKMSYTWDSNIKVWWSADLESLPVLTDSEARAIAIEILDFVIR